jgi:hypothetical protein
LLWGPVGLVLTLVGSKYGSGWWFVFAWFCIAWIIWREAGRTKEIWLVRILGLVLLGAALFGLSAWLRPPASPPVATAPTELPRATEPSTPAPAAPPAQATTQTQATPAPPVLSKAEQRRIVFRLKDAYVKAHPEATAQQVLTAVNRQLANRGIPARLIITAPSPENKVSAAPPSAPAQNQQCWATTEMDGIHINGLEYGIVNNDPHRCDSLKNVTIENGKIGILHGTTPDPTKPLPGTSAPATPPSTVAPH